MCNRKTGILLFLLPLLMHCRSNNAVGKDFHFTQMDKDQTHIDFNNEITESDSVNIFINEYMYNGSGVGIGDFNNDGLPDIFFCGSMVSSKLFINKGGFSFEDVTDKAGVQTDKWCTGASVVDINNDGFQDIYVCASHSPDPEKRKNLLFVNDGKLHFTEQAAAYGLADTGYTTQAAFFDYDKDGDIDMYLLNHRIYSHTANNLQPKDTSGYSPAADRLYRNEGMPAGQSHPVFQDVSAAAGIKEDGYGLGVVITDVNNDNRPDIYVANDYIANDLLWLNNGDGSFSNVIASSIRHQSYNSMGVDAADINNDLLPDLAAVDMLPESNERKKLMFSSNGQEKFDMQGRYGYEPAYMRNMLQLHNGNRRFNQRNEPFYSEIGQLAGISETDWSWSILLADFDNDEWKDIYITNGLGKDVTNNDYASFRNAKSYSTNYTFGGSNAGPVPGAGTIKEMRKEIDEYGSIKMNNYFFHNRGDLTFSNITKQAGLAVPSLSNGAAYADLDNDGDLDLVVNNINQQAFLWRNEVKQSVSDSTKNFLTIQLKGPAENRAGLGSKVTIYTNTSKQFLEQSPVRGFSSSIDYRLHFGTANTTVIDSLRIEWPDDKIQVIQAIKANQSLTLNYADAKMPAAGNMIVTYPLFRDITDQSGIVFRHTETNYYDFGYQRVLPQKYSQLGPCIATADVNGDGLTDFFVDGAANQSGRLFIQQGDNSFTAKDLTGEAKLQEDLCAVFFDSDGDADPDLLVTGGSAEFGPNSSINDVRLYTNDGKGNFTLNKTALPAGLSIISQAVAAADYDGDGDQDLFIGGRVLPGQYPAPPRSYILQNNKGVFTDVTQQICPALVNPGMLTAAIWTDFTNDKRPDLIICGEWMPVRFFENKNGKLDEITGLTGLQHGAGMWRSLQAADIDGDGDMDYVAGNMGLNNKYHTSGDRPMFLYTKDIDKNGSVDLVPAYYIKNNKDDYVLFPGIDRNQLAEEVPSVKKKYLLHKDYAKVSLQQLINDYSPEGWTELKCEIMESGWLENKGNRQFGWHALPLAAQFAPVNAIIANDLDNDGITDLLLAGNEYQAEASTGRYDASYGLFLKGSGKGSFVPAGPASTGFILDGDVRGMKLLPGKGKTNIIVGFNNDRLRYFQCTN